MITAIVTVTVIFIVGFAWVTIASERNFQRRKEELLRKQIERKQNSDAK